MFVERILSLLLAAAQRSKWGVLFVFAGALGLLGLLIFGFVSMVGNAILLMAGVKPALQFLGSGWGIMAVAGISILFVFVGVGVLWFLRPQTPQSTPDVGKSSSPTSPSTESNSEQLKYQNQLLRKQVEKATAELSLPANVAVECHIANRDFRIHDLLKLAGTDSVIEGKEFENCTIRGPATITTAAPPRPPEKRRGSAATASVFHVPTLYVDGDPDSVLQEVPSGGAAASGVIHLVGCSYKRVTFTGIAIAGGADELNWWRDNATFSRESAASRPASQESPIELGDTARLFLTDGSRFVPDDDSERRTIFFPALINEWAGPMTKAVGEGRTFVARQTEFDDCDIYGPVVFVLAQGTVEQTFHKCDWEEEWKAFWPAGKPGRYVGVIALENCIFRRCNFKGAAFVVQPDEYRHLYRRFTGADSDAR